MPGVDIRPAAYAVITDDEGRMLLPHWHHETLGGGWTLPGGGVEPGEHPDDAAVREVREETGYDVELTGVLAVDSQVIPGDRRGDPAREGVPLQALRIIYTAQIVGGSLQIEQEGSTDDVGWHAPDEVEALDRVSMVDFARERAGLIPRRLPRR